MKKVFAAIVVILLLYYPETAVNAARQAMHTWVTAVAPSMFPFMALMPMLTCPESARAWEFMLGKLTRCAFNLPGAAAPAIAIGMLAGSPAGAHAAVQTCAAAGMNSAQLRRIAYCACGMSPAFLITGVGAVMRGNPADGTLLLRAQIFAQIALLLLTRGDTRGESLPSIEETAPQDPIRAAILNLLGVCGYMMLFATAAAIASEIMKNPRAGRWILCILDAPSAAQTLSRRHLCLTAAAIGFGGLCIAAQNLSVLKKFGVRPWEYILYRIASAAFTTAAAALQIRFLRPSTEKTLPILEFSTLISVLFLIPTLIILKKDPFLNKRKLEIKAEKSAEIGGKTQYVVSKVDV